MAVQIIAEVGECFNGSMERARKMIKEAAQAGCDIVKFQILDMDEVSANDPEYDWFQKIDTGFPENCLVSCRRRDSHR